jgi:hypothetical protein
VTVDADTVIAACATVIALVSVGVSVDQARSTRDHNRRSVRPILLVRAGFRPGEVAGLRVTNVGLGPAAVTRTELWLDGVHVGGTDQAGVDRLRETLAGERPGAVTFGDGTFLATDYDEYLLYLPEYDARRHADFATLVGERIRVRISYDSLYGGEAFVAEGPKRPAT